MKRTLGIVLALLFLLALHATPALAQTYAFDESNSSLEINVYKEGLFSAFGHNHLIAANDFSGSLQFDPSEIENSSVTLRVAPKSLTVVDPGVSAGERRQVQASMLGPEVLDVERYPEIWFRSTRVAGVKRQGRGWRVTLTGTLQLHGAQRPVTFPLVVQLDNGQLTAQGDADILQTDFGITPIKVAGGAVKAKNRLRIHFDIRARSQQNASASAASDPKWAVTWSDEFNGPNGAPPDPKKWIFETGGNGWGNHELEYYTSRSENVRQENGDLVIEAIKQPFIGADGVRRDYTSARIATAGRFSQKYGRFEARIKLPPGRGLWPAFWLLGDNCKTVGWPRCGEIDIMENIGSEPAVNHGSMHGPGYSDGHALTAIYTLASGRFSDGFHTFSIEWQPSVVRFYVDGHLYETRTPADIPGRRWVFDHPFFIILNVAVGGDFPGNPDASTAFPQRMQVDYIRVYSRE
jgi:beta-glucanase (GH16 family)/polyisoprenoid-binding protein YceI